MKFTKLGHSCILVETDTPNKRSYLFDPGVYSNIDIDHLLALDYLLVTHLHPDHMDAELIKRLCEKFPELKITAPEDAVSALTSAGINASSNAPEGIELFESPHETIRPFYEDEPPMEFGYNLQNKFAHPGDSHSFSASVPVVALPVQAPWGSILRATELAISLKPKYIIPIHDWHWSEPARQQLLGQLVLVLQKNDTKLVMPNNNQPFELDV